MEKYDNLVLFDVGGVLLRLDFNLFYEAAAKAAGTTAEEFRKIYADSRLEVRSLDGTINKNEYFGGIRYLIGKNLTNEEIGLIKERAWASQIDEMVGLKKRVYEAGNAVGILSNTDEHALETLPVRYPQIYELFNPSFPQIFSCRMKMMKPEIKMYNEAEKFGAKKIVFIDDKETYAKVPVKELGWHGILFTQYVDKSEAIRQIEKDKPAEVSQNLRTADSVSEVEKALREFGVSV